MASVPTLNLVTNGDYPTDLTGWTTSGTVTIATNKIRLAAAASIRQSITPPTLPSDLLVEIKGSFVSDVPAGECYAQATLTASGTVNDVRIIPLPAMSQGNAFTISSNLQFSFEEGTTPTWDISIASMAPLLIEYIKIWSYADTALEEAKEEIKQDVENRYTEFKSDLDGVKYTVGVNKQQTDEAVSNLQTSIEVTAAGIRADITAEHNYFTGEVSKLNTSINVTAQGLTADINQVKSDLSGNVQTLNTSISALAGQVNLKASQTTVDAMGTRVTTAEQNISALDGSIKTKVSTTDYNGNTIASLINQTSTYITIQASKINLVGAVSVLSDITGRLGTITSGYINISESATIGTTLQIGQDWQSSYSKAIRFAGSYGSAGIGYSGGDLTISSLYNINLDADRIRVLGTLDASVASASYATSAGSANTASDVGGYTLARSTSAGKTYITFRYNGSYLGQVALA